MSNFGIEITGIILKEVIRRILEEWVRNGKGLKRRSSGPLSILERRYGPARGTAYRKLPDPNPHQRRETDVGTKAA